MNKNSKISLHTGNKMPVMGLGTWKLLDDTADTVAKAVELGYCMIDTSKDYGTHPGIANALNRASIDRDSLYIVTKVEEDEDAYQASQLCLKELELDHVDLLLVHRPPKTGAGVHLWKGLIRAQEKGLTTDIGVSNYSVEELETLIDETDQVPVVNQIEWSPFGHSDEMLSFCRDNDIVIQAYSPLTRTEKLDNKTLNDIADEHDKSPAQIMIRWNLQRATVPLPKANDISHLEENIDVFDFELSDAQMQQLDDLNTEFSALGDKPQYI